MIGLVLLEGPEAFFGLSPPGAFGIVTGFYDEETRFYGEEDQTNYGKGGEGAHPKKLIPNDEHFANARARQFNLPMLERRWKTKRMTACQPKL